MLHVLAVNAQVNVQSVDSLDKELDLHEVVVTGTRTPKFLKDTPIQTRVITSRDIQRTDATNVMDLLTQELPGVEFSYAMNQQTHLNFAGFGGQGVLFLVDGERLAGETMDDVDFSRLTMAGVERIEIVKGAASALYGSNATGGVINIITKEMHSPWTLNVGGRYGKHNQQRYDASWGVSRKRWSNMLTANYNSLDNYDVKSDANPATRVISTIYGDKTLNLKEQMTWKASQRLSLSGRLGYFFRETCRTPEMPERYRDFSGGVRSLWHISDKDVLEANYAFDQYDKSDFQRLVGLDIRDYSNVQNTLRTLYHHTFEHGDPSRSLREPSGQAISSGQAGLRTSVLTIGADYMHDYLFNSNLTNSKYHQDNFDVFAQYDWQISDRLEVVGALRYDWFSDTHDSHLTPKLNARYKILPRLALRAGYGMGFRAPTLKEKYYNFDMSGIWIVEGNPELKPEVSHNFNVSAEYTRGHYNLTASAYYNLVTNKIATSLPYFRSPNDRLPYLPYSNLDRYNVYGAELGAQARWSSGISARLTYAFTKEELPTGKDGQQTNNQYIPARPHSLNASINYDHAFTSHYGISIGLSGRVLSSVESTEYRNYYDISQGTVAINYPAYTIWKLSLVQTFYEAFRLTLALDNLFNYRPRYYYLNAPITDGAWFQVGLSMDIDKIGKSCRK